MKAKSILIADDDRSMRKALAFELAEQGYAVTEASDGREAIELVEHTAFDLVISDLIMPKANGMQVYHTAQKLRPGTNFLTISAFSDSDEARAAERLFGENFVRKPFHLKELLEKIRNFFQEP